MTEKEYRAIPALSYSSMKDLLVSPMRFWYLHINPERPEPMETPAMRFGKALHCAVLTPNKFSVEYAESCKLPEDCLDTIDELRARLKDLGIAPKGTRKAEVIAQLLAVQPQAPIKSVIEESHAKENEGKIILAPDEWSRVEGCRSALMNEPVVQGLLSSGGPEIIYRATEGSIQLKGRMDWVTVEKIVDFKTFAQMGDRSIDRSVANAILYQGYHLQAYFYTMLRRMNAAPGMDRQVDFVMPFVEAQPPHEVRIKVLRPTVAGEVNLYWEQARFKVQEAIKLYGECIERFGDRPWKLESKADPLIDSDMPGLAFGD